MKPENNSRAAMWRHYWWHLRAGIIFWAVIGGGAFGYSFFTAALTNSAHRAQEFSGMRAYLLLILIVLLLFSLSAALGGLLRLPALRWLRRYSRSQVEFVINSILLFAATVALAAGGYWLFESDHALATFCYCLLVCFVISLPWLVATGWASWRLAQAVGQPARQP